MANKHNDYFNKQSTKSNLGSKNDIKKKKKFTFYVVVCAIIFCILGSILGSVAFVENRVAKAELNPAITELNFSKSLVPTSGSPSMQGTYLIENGVSTNIGINDYKNIGWANYNAERNTIFIRKFTNLTSEGEGIVYNYPYVQFTCFNGAVKIVPFITFNGQIALAPNTTYVVKVQFYVPDLTTLSNFEFYFLGGDRVDLLEKAKDTTIIGVENTNVRELTFTVANDTNDYLYYGSYRFDVQFSSTDPLGSEVYQYFRLYSTSIVIADYNDGFNDGYKDGFNTANKDEYSWFNLFGSLIDVPIQAFTNLFNFEVFGQNLTNFFLAIFTFAVIIKVIQLLL